MEQSPIAFRVPERGMQVEGASSLRHGPFRHEGDGDLVERGDFLDAVLVNDVPIAHLERLGEAQVDLLLAEAPLAFAVFDRNPCCLHPVPDQAVEPLRLGALQDVIVLDVAAIGLEAAVVFRPGLLVAVAEEEELELRSDLRIEAELAGSLYLAA